MAVVSLLEEESSAERASSIEQWRDPLISMNEEQLTEPSTASLSSATCVCVWMGVCGGGVQGCSTSQFIAL